MSILEPPVPFEVGKKYRWQWSSPESAIVRSGEGECVMVAGQYVTIGDDSFSITAEGFVAEEIA